MQSNLQYSTFCLDTCFRVFSIASALYVGEQHLDLSADSEVLHYFVTFSVLYQVRKERCMGHTR